MPALFPLSRVFACSVRLLPASCFPLGPALQLLSRPPRRAHLTREGQKDSRVRLPRFLNTIHSDQFCHFVLFFLLSRVLRDTESQLHQRHEEVSLLRRW